MNALVVAVQVVLPLALLLWLALLPGPSLVGFAAQAAGTAAFLFALGRVAQWAVPVWWLPHVYGGPLARRRRHQALLAPYRRVRL